VIPASASRYFRRSTRRAIIVSSSGLSVGSASSSRVKSAPISDRVRCMAGKTMWYGGSRRSWTMNSPRSDSTTSIPAFSIASPRPISSAVMAFDLTTDRT
jgi:hypothetical protein